MSYAPRRAALLSLCVLAILLAASLFPATGFGTVPSVTAPAPAVPDGSPTDSAPTTGEAPTPTDDPPTRTTRSTTAEPTTPTTTTTDAAVTTGQSNQGGGGTTLDGAVLTIFAALGALFPFVLGVVLYALGYRRHGWWLESDGEYDLPDLPPPRIRAAIQSIPRTTMGLVMGLSASIPGLLDSLGTVVRESVDGAAMVLDGFATALEQLAVGLPTAFARGFGAFGRGFGAALGGLPSVFVSLGTGLTDRNLPSFGGWSTDDDSTPTRDARGETERPPPRTVEEAWARMTESVHVRNRRAATPTDYARAAIARGYPKRAVQRLTRLFQEVRYGGFSADERTAAALDAFERFEQRADRGEDS